MKDLDDILAAIAALSLRDRQRLWRRTLQMGLFPEAGQADQEETAEPAALVPRSVPPRMLESAPSAPPPSDEERKVKTPWIHHAHLVFDGGSKGNPGKGYGSYQLTWNDRAEPVQRITLGDQVTNNEAEYDTLIVALEAILQEIESSDLKTKQVALDIRGDSKLVISQITGAWKASEPRLRQRRDRVRKLLERFGQVTLQQHPRSTSVELLGH